MKLFPAHFSLFEWTCLVWPLRNTALQGSDLYIQVPSFVTRSDNLDLLHFRIINGRFLINNPFVLKSNDGGPLITNLSQF